MLPFNLRGQEVKADLSFWFCDPEKNVVFLKVPQDSDDAADDWKGRGFGAPVSMKWLCWGNAAWVLLLILDR